MKYNGEVINAIGYMRKNRKIIYYLASIRKDSNKTVVYRMDEKVKQKTLNEFFLNSINTSYEQLEDAIKDLNKTENVLWITKDGIAFERSIDSNTIYKEF